MNQMLCGYRDDERLWDQADTNSAMQAQRVEDYADNLLAECITLAGAERVNRANDLYDGDLLTRLMTEIANWTGRSDDAAQQMRKLHVLLAGELQKVAELEVAA